MTYSYKNFNPKILGCQESSCDISNFDFKLCTYKKVFVVFLFCIYHFKERFLHYLMVIILIVSKKLCFFQNVEPKVKKKQICAIFFF